MGNITISGSKTLTITSTSSKSLVIPIPVATFTWVRIDGTDSQGGFAATYELIGDETNDDDMIANCEFQVPANFYQGQTINYFNTAYNYYTLFQSTVT
jgi:hypothetical protein